jgi:hypothetical protein
MRINDKPAVFNRIRGTLYVEQQDEIGAHFRPGSDIISLSLGDAREFALTSEQGGEKQRAALEDGDVFVLGPRARLKHAVLPVKDEQIIERNGTGAGPPRQGSTEPSKVNRTVASLSHTCALLRTASRQISPHRIVWMKGETAVPNV